MNTADGYRYGFNGKEKDDEIKNGNGNSLDFGARMYDPRIGRWLSRDPLERTFPSLSAYNSFANNPIIFIDSDGKKFVIPDNLSKSQRIKVQFMIDILKLVKPGIYTYLENSEIKINVSVGIIDQTGVPKGTVLDGFTKFPDTNYKGLYDEDGNWKTKDFKISLSKAIIVDSVKYEDLYMKSDSPKTEMVPISEEVANSIAKLNPLTDEINVLVENKDDAFFMASIGGHEFGHVYFGLLNPAYHYVLSDLLPGVNGHNNNLRYGETHPDGKYAFDLQTEVGNLILKTQIDAYEEMKKKYEKDLKAALKEEKNEKKKEP